jgi:hypothetical protein
LLKFGSILMPIIRLMRMISLECKMILGDRNLKNV